MSREHPVNHASTTALILAGFIVLTLALAGKALVATTDPSRFTFTLLTMAVAWAGVVTYLVHRRWVRHLPERPRHEHAEKYDDIDW